MSILLTVYDDHYFLFKSLFNAFSTQFFVNNVTIYV